MIAQSKSHKRPSGLEADEEFERRKQQWQVKHHLVVQSGPKVYITPK